MYSEMNSEHLDRKSDSDACPAHLEQGLKDLEESRSKLLQHPLCRTLVQLLQGINAGSRGLQIQPPPVSTAVRMRQLLKSPQAPNVPPSSSEPDLTSMCRPLCIREFYRLWTPPDGGEVVPASNGARQAAASPGLNNAQRRLHASYAQYLFLHRQIDALRWKVSKEWLVDLWGRCGLHFQDIRRLDLRDGLGRSGEDPASALELQNFVDDCMRSQLVPGQMESRVQFLWYKISTAFNRLDSHYIGHGVKRISTPGQRQVAIVWPFQTEPEGCIAVPARVVRTRDPTRPVDWRQDAAAMALYQMARSSFPPSQKILRDRLPQESRVRVTKPKKPRAVKRKLSAEPARPPKPKKPRQSSLAQVDEDADSDASAEFASVVTRSGRRSRVFRASKVHGPEFQSDEEETPGSSPSPTKPVSKKKRPRRRMRAQRKPGHVMSPARRWQLFEEHRKMRASGGAGKRALPEAAVKILKEWFLDHFEDPYPDDDEKLALAEKTGLEVRQVNYWFINSRVRIWKPLTQGSAAGLIHSSPEHQGSEGDEDRSSSSSKRSSRRSRPSRDSLLSPSSAPASSPKLPNG